MTHKLFSIAAAAAVSLFLGASPLAAQDKPAPAPAEGAKAPVVIVVDMNKIMTESAAAKSIQAQVADLRKSLKAEVDKKEADLRSQDEKLGKERASLSAEAFEKKARSFQEEIMKSRRDVDTRANAMDRSVAVAMGKVERELQGILFEIAKDQKANLVLPKSAILVAETSMEFTDEAMKRLNAKLPSVKVETAAPAAAAKPADKKK